MTRSSSWLLAAALILASSMAALAASRTGWDRTWRGAWGGDANQATSVTVANDRVVGYTYQGASHPVASSTVTPGMIRYSDQGNTVTLTKRSATTAAASLYTQQGNATAVLTRQ